MAEIETFADERLLQICAALGHPTEGLTGAEIGTYLLRLGAPDPGPGVAKRTRLFAGLRARQNLDHHGAVVAAFIHTTLDPVRYVGNRNLFESRREALNQALRGSGFELHADGKLDRQNPSGPQRSHSQMVNELTRRGVHPAVAKVFSQDNTSAEKTDTGTAFRNATQDLVRRFKQTSDLAADDHEQEALTYLTKGLYLLAELANADERDLMDLLSLASLLHRRLDDVEMQFAASPHRPTPADRGKDLPQDAN